MLEFQRPESPARQKCEVWPKSSVWQKYWEHSVVAPSSRFPRLTTVLAEYGNMRLDTSQSIQNQNTRTVSTASIVIIFSFASIIHARCSTYCKDVLLSPVNQISTA